jgi:hypothetical protein
MAVPPDRALPLSRNLSCLARNLIVHEALLIEPAEASDSLSAVEAMIEHVEGVRRRGTS